MASTSLKSINGPGRRDCGWARRVPAVLVWDTDATAVTHRAERTEGKGESLPTVYLSRHGETVWSLTGQQTSLVDLWLTGRNEHPPGSSLSISRG